MKDIPRIITGILLILLGLGLIFVILSSGNYTLLSALSLVFIIIGIVILSNKKENKIEEIKRNKSQHDS